jgi:hypothetical protein
MKTIILNTNYNNKIGLLIFFVFILNFQSISKSHLLISKTTYNTACAVSQDTHPNDGFFNFENDPEPPINVSLIELCDPDIDCFSLNNRYVFFESIAFVSLYKKFKSSDYQFNKVEIFLPPPRI